MTRVLLLVMLLVCLPARLVWADAQQRMNMERLRATHLAIEALQGKLKKVSLESGFQDTRALLHVHSAFSHDSRGQLDDIVAAANKVGAKVIMFSEHPAPHYDYVKDGHRGMRDGVLLIPGAETGGFLAWPKRSIQDEKTEGPQAFADLVKSTSGLVFVAHLEERMDWEIKGLTGNEIYNTHADFMEETQLIASMRSPITLLSLVSATKQYPQEVFGALLDYPAAYLKRWDQLCQQARHTGISANDAHHNQAYRARVIEGGKVELEDALGKKLATLDPEKISAVKLLVGKKQPGDLVLELDLDPYERSFRHVSTHLLLSELNEENVWDALNEGRAYVAFDWIADPTGFVFKADCGEQSWPLGSEVTLQEGLRLQAEAPLEGTIKLVRNGEIVQELQGSTLEYAVESPGNYRLEVWQTLAGEPRPWILSNPIYVRAKP